LAGFPTNLRRTLTTGNPSEGKRDEALSLLRAVDHGLAPDYDLEIEKDPDFKALHGDPRFDDLVAHAKERAVAAQKPK
jgi:hypothetical protein